MSSYTVAWAWAFAFTQLIEVPLYRRLLSCSRWRAFGASALTHPILWLVFPSIRANYALAVVLAECFVWLAEALYFARPYGLRRAMGASMLANAASCLLGFLSRAWFGAP